MDARKSGYTRGDFDAPTTELQQYKAAADQGREVIEQNAAQATESAKAIVDDPNTPEEDRRWAQELISAGGRFR